MVGWHPSKEVIIYWYQDYNNHCQDLENIQVDVDTLVTVAFRIPRFGGHTRKAYYLGQHSLLVHDLVVNNNPSLLGLPALLHDAHEVYSGLGDVYKTVFEGENEL